LVSLQAKWFNQVNDFNNDSLSLTSQERQYLHKKEFITMCVDPDWEPYEQIDKNGNHIGLAADFIKLVEEKVGKKIKLVETKTWEESLAFIQNDKCEILSFLNQTAKRDNYLNFTPVIYSEPEVIVAKNDVAYFDGFKSLNNKTVGIVKGYRTDEYILKKYPKIKIKYIKNYENGIMLVSQGKLDATINSLFGTAHLIKKSQLFDIKIAGKTKLFNNYRIGIAKDDQMLHSILSKAISSITQSEKNKIISSWGSVKFEQKIDYTLIIQIISIFGLITLILLYRQYVIKKINKELKEQMREQLDEIVIKDRLLFQQTRLAQMGEMISMIAHQWRQPLGSISSAVVAVDMNLKTKRFNLDSKEGLNSFLEFLDKKHKNILKYSNYLSHTVEDFRSFFRPDKQQELCTLDEPIAQALQVIEVSLKNQGIVLNYNFNSKKKLHIYKNEMIQVVLNILKNSADNFELKDIKNPTIDIKTTNHTIIISDNGGGINDDVINHIFDPYFSTKNDKNGTGLGLYMSKIIIENHNGGKISAKNIDDGVQIRIDFKAINQK
jgi:signal transduction histidine kinase